MGSQLSNERQPTLAETHLQVVWFEQIIIRFRSKSTVRTVLYYTIPVDCYGTVRYVNRKKVTNSVTRVRQPHRNRIILPDSNVYRYRYSTTVLLVVQRFVGCHWALPALGICTVILYVPVFVLCPCVWSSHSDSRASTVDIAADKQTRQRP